MNANNEWYTPPYIMELVREVLGDINVDPATCAIAQKAVLADTWFTEESDGLAHPWEGTVWCNPPYSMVLLRQFTNKFLEESLNGNMTEGIMLTNSGTDTLWNQTLSGFMQAYTIGRISFLMPNGMEKGKGGRGQVFSYFGENKEHFAKVFTANGFCWLPNYELD